MASRRALSLSSSLFRHYGFYRRFTPTASTNSVSSLLCTLLSSSPQIRTPRRGLHSTPFSPLSSRPLNDGDKIDPDTILFEGCDYKHWLIVMDFPNDPQQRPPAEEMVETYVQTLAKVVGSVEEAKKKMYACSTTTYTGFQAEIDEETAQKFEGMPGVLFVLPDSYIDPVNKEYGGDKYINGTIIPRPPPVQYGRVRRGGRQNDQRMSGPMPNQQGSPAYNQHEGAGRGYMPQQGVPQQLGFAQQQSFMPQQGQQGFPQQQSFPPQQGQQCFPPQQGQQGFPQQQSFPPQRGQQGFPPQQGQQRFPPQQGQQGFQPQRGFPPQQGFLQQQVYPPQQGYPQQQRIPAQQSYGPPGQGERGNPLPSGTCYPGGGRDTYQGVGNSHMPSHTGNQNNEYNDFQGQMGSHPRDQRGYAPQGQMGPAGANRNYNYPPPAAGAYGQTVVGTFDQGGAVQDGPRSGGTCNHGAGVGYAQGYRPDGQYQRSAQIPDEHGNTFSMEHRSYEPTGHNGLNQGGN